MAAAPGSTTTERAELRDARSSAGSSSLRTRSYAGLTTVQQVAETRAAFGPLNHLRGQWYALIGPGISLAKAFDLGLMTRRRGAAQEYCAPRRRPGWGDGRSEREEWSPEDPREVPRTGHHESPPNGTSYSSPQGHHHSLEQHQQQHRPPSHGRARWSRVGHERRETARHRAASTSRRIAGIKAVPTLRDTVVHWRVPVGAEFESQPRVHVSVDVVTGGLAPRSNISSNKRAVTGSHPTSSSERRGGQKPMSGH